VSIFCLNSAKDMSPNLFIRTARVRAAADRVRVWECGLAFHSEMNLWFDANVA
jgi:hypothetical protein